MNIKYWDYIGIHKTAHIEELDVVGSSFSRRLPTSFSYTIEEDAYVNLSESINSNNLKYLAHVIAYLKKYFNIDAPFCKYEDYGTLLHMASKRNNCEVVKLVLDVGADPNTKDDSRRTPMRLATSDAVRSLLRLYGGQE